jgi:lysophospholipase L1-like esterase
MLLFLLSCSGRDPVDTAPPVNWDDLSVREKCFGEVGNDASSLPQYDQFNPTIGTHCSGTNHQNILDIEKVVFLGDSVTTGTPPTPSDEYYRSVLTDKLTEQFGDIEVADCSAWGARTDDLLLPPHEQIHTCFPEVENKRTLVILTVGGNDMMALVEDLLAGASPEDILASVEQYADLMDEAVRWFSDNAPVLFPGGVSVIFGNVYEYTDATGDITACELADDFGYGELGDNAAALRDAYIRINERFMQTATATRTDVIFMLESFCGHGFYADDPDNECYRGPEAETWFDLTCIHPTPTGHAQIAGMFMDVVME